MNNIEIAERVEKLRNDRNYSVNKLATTCGIDTANLSRSLKGKASFSDRVLMKIASALNVSLEWLEHGTGSMLPTDVSDSSSSNVNGNNSPNVHQSIGGSVNDAALLRENELLREQNEFQKRQIDRLMAMLENK